MALVEVATVPVGAEVRRPSVPRSVQRLGGVIILVAVWQLVSTLGWVSDDTLAAPTDVVSTAWDMIRDGTLPDAMWVSLKRVLIGLGVGIVIGVTLAVGAGLSRIGEDLLDTPLQTLRFVPVIGLQPLIVQWFGIGEAAKISLIVIAVLFPVYINTFSAITSIDQRYLELAKVRGLGRGARIRRIVLPGALPGFLVGLRMAAAVSWLILVFAEQINAKSGIGFLIIRAQTFFQTDAIIACLAVYAVLGLLTDFGLRALDRKVLTWHPSR